MKRIGCWVFVLFSLGVQAQHKWDTIPKLPDHYRARTAEFKKQTAIKNRILLIGDGFIEHGDWRTLLNDSTVINRGIDGDITFGVMVRLNDLNVVQPSSIFLMIGLEDIAKKIPEETIIENLFTIAARLRKRCPEAHIYIQSILPVNSSFKAFPAVYDKNEMIFTIDEQLRRYAGKLGYVYTDLFKSFVDQKGKLDTRYTADGLHLNAAGYTHWVQSLKELNYF